MTSATDLNFQHLLVSLSLVPYYKLVYVLLSLWLSHTQTQNTLSHTVLFFFLKKETASELLKGKTDCCLRTLSFSLTTQLTTVIDAASTTEFPKQRDWTMVWQRRWWTGGDVAVFALLIVAVFSLIKEEEITSNTWHNIRPWINLTALVIWKVGL